MQQEMKKFILLSLLAICYNILPALAQYEYSPQCKMNFGKGEVYSIEVGGNEKENNDTILGNSVAIILRKNGKEISRFNTFTIDDNCPADGFRDIKVKGHYFTIEDSYCAGFYFVLTYTTFRYDTKRKEFVLHRYGESYVYRGDPEKDIPDNSYLVKEYIPFSKVTTELLLELRNNFK